MLTVTLRGDHFDISKNVDTYTRERFVNLDRYLADAQAVDVCVSSAGGQYKVKADLKNEHLPPMHAEATEATVYEALRRASELVRKQMRRQHNKLAKQY